MKWTIGMPSYANLIEVWFTVQALRMYHDMTDCEILIVDNFGDDKIAKFVKKDGGSVVRYERFTEPNGVSPAKNRIFELARGEFVLCMDSHIMIMPGALDKTPPGDDMIQGPLMFSNCKSYGCSWLPQWRSQMWGIWGPTVSELPKDPFEIWATGAGFFACRRDSWLGFNSKFRGFGGETGYIQEKYRKHGRRVWCYPNMIWLHLFYNEGRPVSIPGGLSSRIRNYIFGFEELGLDLAPIIEHFGEAAVSIAMRTLPAELVGA